MVDPPFFYPPCPVQLGNFQPPQNELGRLFHVQKYRATKYAGDRHDGQNKLVPAYYIIAAGVLSIVMVGSTLSGVRRARLSPATPA
jgi:hypothetical protein